MRKKILVSDLSYDEKEVSAVISVIRSEWMTTGPVTNRFEECFGQYVGYPYAIAVSNGTAGINSWSSSIKSDCIFPLPFLLA